MLFPKPSYYVQAMLTFPCFVLITCLVLLDLTDLCMPIPNFFDTLPMKYAHCRDPATKKAAYLVGYLPSCTYLCLPIKPDAYPQPLLSILYYCLSLPSSLCLRANRMNSYNVRIQATSHAIAANRGYLLLGKTRDHLRGTHSRVRDIPIIRSHIWYNAILLFSLA
jgi:hypothetical protein